MTEKGPITIISSNLNFSPADAMRRGVAWHRDAIRAYGYDGMALYPLRSRLTAEMALGVDAGDFIVALHQSWRTTRARDIVGFIMNGIRALPTDREQAFHSFFEAALHASMPPMQGSDRKLDRLERRLTRKAHRMPVPIVVHPWGQIARDPLTTSGPASGAHFDYHELGRMQTGPLRWQPTVDFARNRGVHYPDDPVRTARGMVDEAKSDGLHGGAAVDTNHLLAPRQGSQLSEAEYLAITEELGRSGNIGCIEVGVQTHLGSTPQHVRSIMEGRIAETPQGEIIAAAVSHLRTVEVTTEMPAREVTWLTDPQDKGGRGMSLQDVHSELLVPAVRQHVVAHLGSALT